MNIQLITECYTHHLGGLSRYEKTIIDTLQKKIPCTITPISEIKKPSRLKQLLFLLSKNTYGKAQTNNDTLTHLLNQQLGLSLNFVQISNPLVTIHDLAFIIPPYCNELKCMDKIRYQLVMNGLKRAKWIITDAEFTKQEIIKYLKFPPQNIFVVPLGVDTHQFHKKKISLQETKTYRKGSLGPVLLYVGSEISRMNFTIILRALARLRKEMPTATLIKVGEAKSLNGRRESMRIIHELQLQNAVSFVEYVSEDELVNYYNTADVFIYPIAYTGYGLPVLEAMACGCPVITTTTSTLPEVAGDAALFFEPSDVVQLQKHISTIITNKKVREKLQKRGFAHIKNLTWEQCAEKTFYVYQQILQLTPEKEGRICLEK